MIPISSHRETLYAVGDVFHYAAEVAHPDCTVPWADEQRMRATRCKLPDDATSTDALVVFTHESFSPCGQTVGNEGGGFRRQGGWANDPVQRGNPAALRRPFTLSERPGDRSHRRPG
jgi:hypothetical protein